MDLFRCMRPSTDAVTDDDIREMQAEFRAIRNMPYVGLCRRALDGDADARRQVAWLIRGSREAV